VYFLRALIAVFGERRILGLFEQTMKVENAGGKFTADGSRRKAPGGVFMDLAKQ